MDKQRRFSRQTFAAFSGQLDEVRWMARLRPWTRIEIGPGRLGPACTWSSGAPVTVRWHGC